jgi:hypothetical protein
VIADLDVTPAEVPGPWPLPTLGTTVHKATRRALYDPRASRPQLRAGTTGAHTRGKSTRYTTPDALSRGRTGGPNSGSMGGRSPSGEVSRSATRSRPPRVAPLRARWPLRRVARSSVPSPVAGADELEATTRRMSVQAES